MLTISAILRRNDRSLRKRQLYLRHGKRSGIGSQLGALRCAVRYRTSALGGMIASIWIRLHRQTTGTTRRSHDYVLVTHPIIEDSESIRRNAGCRGLLLDGYAYTLP